VNTAFAEKHPEVVIAYLRAAIRGAGSTPTGGGGDDSQPGHVPSHGGGHDQGIAKFDFVPNLSPKNLPELKLKKLLRDHGYLQRDFDVKAWADASFLQEALKGLDRQ